MKHTIQTIVLVTSLVFATSAFASGVLVGAKGAVNLSLPNGKATAAKTGVELPDGSKISVGKGGSASVMLMDGAIETLGSGQKYTVGQTDKSAGKRTVIDGIAIAMNEATASSSGPTVHGMVKMGQLGPGAPKPGIISAAGNQGLFAVYPINTAIGAAKQLTFKWNGGTQLKITNPTFIIEDGAGTRIVSMRADPAKGEVAADASKLLPGNKYSWYYAADEHGKLLQKSRRFDFAVISDAEKKKLEGDIARVNSLDMSEDGKKFLTAQLYYRTRMVDAMVKELLPLWRTNPSDAVKRLLYMGYVKMGQTKEALKYQ